MEKVQIDTYRICDEQGREMELALMDVFEKDGVQYASLSEIIDDEIQDDVYLYRCHGSGMDMTFEMIGEDEFFDIAEYYMSFYDI
ncbi:DUF1292 domain-containing protein [Floccifex sp.]|uniref:DUF1292 domain-containing protein n=1 Tax=Floccifex sp. TaxID=2815810 RepID=UPI002A74A0A0|nr:DUF1292 domain-containing protein [Floccifex sp.]MDD7282075.1 DUF1292 domain-containing protein [Erysipelotrichaceae bacterium]MDY2958985.1 DUF1292 domain-containing protein [Floccifex sp.]